MIMDTNNSSHILAVTLPRVWPVLLIFCHPGEFDGIFFG